jgi:hypothetical protein
MPTVRQLIQQLKKLDPNKRISLCADPDLYLYQQTNDREGTVYTLDHTDFTRDGHGAILLHDFQGVEPSTKRWAEAIATRIIEDPETLLEYANESGDARLPMTLLKSYTEAKPKRTIVKLLMENPVLVYELIGTSVIEEGYFDDLN